MDSNSGFPPKQLDDKWRGFSSTITRLLKQVDVMKYDGITANERARASLIAYTYDRYLLPQKTDWLSTDALFQPLPAPQFPDVPEHSKPAEKKALQEQIAEKRRSLEEIYNSEVPRLIELRARYSNQEPEALAALIEISNRRHSISYVSRWLSYLCRSKRKGRAHRDSIPGLRKA